MEPKILGIGLFPEVYRLTIGGSLSTRCDIQTYPCTKSCEVKFDREVKHRIICEGNPVKDFEGWFVSVRGDIVQTKGKSTGAKITLDERMWESAARGRDGSYRPCWHWPNLNSHMEIGAEYKVSLTILKKKVREDKPEQEVQQESFTVKLFDPPPLVDPTKPLKDPCKNHLPIRN
jgi:hypothetical protein